MSAFKASTNVHRRTGVFVIGQGAERKELAIPVVAPMTNLIPIRETNYRIGVGSVKKADRQPETVNCESERQEFSDCEDIMHRGWLQAAVVAVGVAAYASVPAGAQMKEVDSLGRTDVGLSIYGAFGGTTTGDNIQQSPSNAAGGIVEVRHISNPIFGFEGTYSF